MVQLIKMQRQQSAKPDKLKNTTRTNLALLGVSEKTQKRNEHDA
jgi:hypothetical protein